MAQPIAQPIDYVERWRSMVAARRQQHDAACAAEGRTTRDYWARRAEGFRKFVAEAADRSDPFLECVLRHVRPGDSVLDVGAGTGRHAIPLARRAGQVIALDPSAAMLRFLRGDVEAEGLTNVTVVEGVWPGVAEKAGEADIVISAHVLYPIEDVVAFLRALDRSARRFCFLNLMVRQPWFDQLGLWEAVHGEARLPQPAYIDAVNVLHQLGCFANVQVDWVETPRVFDGLDAAVDRFAEAVAVGEDSARRARLKSALERALVPLAGGCYGLPRGRYPLATVWWEAGALRNA